MSMISRAEALLISHAQVLGAYIQTNKKRLGHVKIR